MKSLFHKIPTGKTGIARTVRVGILLFLMLVFPFSSFAQTSSSGSGSAVASAAGGAAACSLSLLGGIFGSTAGAGAGSAVAASIVPNAIVSVPVGDKPAEGALAVITGSTVANTAYHLSDTTRDDVLSCIARAVARAMLQQITISTVNWINGGFNGSPSFVQNYQQFFTNVADQAAGNFIQGSDLAFLCSPFRLQIRIAVAQAYLQYAPSCTLTDVTNNIQGFMNSFSQGGWPAYLSFTTVPMNNPYGAFMYAQAGVQSAIANAQGVKQLDLTLGSGFMSTQQKTNCTITNTPPASTAGKSVETVAGENQDYYRVCDVSITTPGTAIAQSLDKALGTNTQSLIDAKTWDESISAIVSALIQQVLYQGLSALNNGGSGYQSNFSTTMASLSSQAGQDLLQQMQDATTPPQQIIGIETQNISDVQNSIAGVQSLQDCWNGAVASSTLTAPETAQAIQNASSTLGTLQSLNSSLTAYQAAFTLATTSLETLSKFMTLVQNTTDINAIQNISSNFISFTMSGQLPSSSNVLSAQLDQTQLATYLSGVNSSTQTELATCRAFPPPPPLVAPTPSGG